MTRVITFPGSLNADTGLVCRDLGHPGDFSRMSVSEIIWESDATRNFYDLSWVKAFELHSHPELEAGIRR